MNSSSVVRAFAHGAMGHRIDPSWWTNGSISCSSQCLMTGITKANNNSSSNNNNFYVALNFKIETICFQ